MVLKHLVQTWVRPVLTLPQEHWQVVVQAGVGLKKVVVQQAVVPAVMADTVGVLVNSATGGSSSSGGSSGGEDATGGGGAGGSPDGGSGGGSASSSDTGGSGGSTPSGPREPTPANTSHSGSSNDHPTYPLTTSEAPRTTRLVPGGGLAVHEAAGGHTLARHVGKTDMELAARLATEPRIPAASTFPDRTTAERAIAAVLEARATDIQNWLAGNTTRIEPPIVVALPYTTGRILFRGATHTIDVQSVLIILQRDASLPTGYRIVTAYPVP
jgi:hypothetical protein